MQYRVPLILASLSHVDFLLKVNAVGLLSPKH